LRLFLIPLLGETRETKQMRKVIGLPLTAAVGAIGLLGLSPAQAADMQAPQAQMQPPPPGYYGPPPPVENYPPPPPPVAYDYPPPPVAYYAPPPPVVVPGPYYGYGYGPYWGGYPRVAYGYGRWHYRHW
jgi:hypothetical protein